MDLKRIFYCVRIIYCFVFALLLLDFSRPDLFSVKHSSFDSKEDLCAAITMGHVDRFEIVFDNHQEVFHEGDRLSGHVEIVNSECIKYKGKCRFLTTICDRIHCFPDWFYLAA